MFPGRQPPQFVDIILEDEDDSSDEEYYPDEDEEEEETAEEVSCFKTQHVFNHLLQ